MKRFISSLLLLALSATSALALSDSAAPPKFGIPWAASAGVPYINSIPVPSQIGIQNCRASLTDGFPPLTFTPPGAGGCPPFGADWNGIIKQITQWSQWQAAGGPVFFDGTFATNAGGYPNGAKLMSAVTPGTVWMSTIDNNTTNPDTAAAANWVQDPGQIPIGTPVASLSTTIQSGYVSANGMTIGSASSNATSRANADTQFLFNYIWNNCNNTQCPIYTSTGSASTRGATPWADFAANKAIATFNLNGTGLMTADSQSGTTSTNLSGVPVSSGSRTVPGSILGENLHTLTLDELATGITSSGSNTINVSSLSTSILSGAVSNGGTGTLGLLGVSASQINSTGVNIINVTSSNTGGGSHNTVERSMITYRNLKL
jgi:hypothetical protein